MLALQKALSLTRLSRRLFGYSPKTLNLNNVSNLSNLLRKLRYEHVTVSQTMTSMQEEEAMVNLCTVRSTMRGLLSDGKLLEILLFDRELRRPFQFNDPSNGQQQQLFGALVADVEIAAIVGIARAWASDSILALIPSQDSLDSSPFAAPDFPFSNTTTISSSFSQRRTKDSSSKETVIADPLQMNRLLLQGYVYRQRWRQAAEVATTMSENEVDEALHASRGVLQLNTFERAGIIKNDGNDVTKSSAREKTTAQDGVTVDSEEPVDKRLYSCIQALDEALGPASSPSKFSSFFNHFLTTNVNNTTKIKSTRSSTLTPPFQSVAHSNIETVANELRLKKAILLDKLLLRVNDAEYDLALRLDKVAGISNSQSLSMVISQQQQRSSTFLKPQFLSLVSSLPLSNDFYSLFSAACVTIRHENGAAWLLQRINAMTQSIEAIVSSDQELITHNSSTTLLSLPLIRAVASTTTGSSAVSFSSSSTVTNKIGTESLYLPLIHSLELLGVGANSQTLSTKSTPTTAASPVSMSQTIDRLLGSISTSTILSCVFILVKKGRYQEAIDGAKALVRIHALRQKRNDKNKPADGTLSVSSISPPPSSSVLSSPLSSSQVHVPFLLRGLLQREAPNLPLAHSSSLEMLQQKDNRNSGLLDLTIATNSSCFENKDVAHWRSALSDEPGLALLTFFSLFKLQRFSEVLQLWKIVSDVVTVSDPLLFHQQKGQKLKKQQEVSMTNSLGDTIMNKDEVVNEDDSVPSSQHYDEEENEEALSGLLYPLTTASIEAHCVNSIGSHSHHHRQTNLLRNQCKNSHAFSSIIMESCLALGKEEEAEAELHRYSTSITTSYARNVSYNNSLMNAKTTSTLHLPVNLLSSALSVVKARVIATSYSLSTSASSFSFADASRWLRFLSSSSSSSTLSTSSSPLPFSTSRQSIISTQMNDQFFEIALLSYTRALSSFTSDSPSSSSSMINDKTIDEISTESSVNSSSSNSNSNEIVNESDETDLSNDASRLALQASFVRLVFDMCNAGLVLSQEMGEQILLASFGIILPTKKNSKKDESEVDLIQAVRTWASCSRNKTSSSSSSPPPSSTIKMQNTPMMTPLIVCRQILASSSLLNLYKCNDRPELFFKLLTLLTHATSAVADEIKAGTSSVGIASVSTSSSSSTSTSSIPLSAHRADRLVLDSVYRDITTSLSHSLLSQAPLASASTEVKALASLRHHRSTFRLLFDVISTSWSFDIASSGSLVPPPPSNGDRFSALQHVDSRSVNAAADCILWVKGVGSGEGGGGSMTGSIALDVDHNVENHTIKMIQKLSIPSFRSGDFAALYYAAAAHSFHRSSKGHHHQSLFSRGGGGGGRFSHPLSSSPSHLINVNGYQDFDGINNILSNGNSTDVNHVSRTVRVLLDSTCQSPNRHQNINDDPHTKGGVHVNDQYLTMNTLYNPLDVPIASLSDLCLHLISSQRSQLWTLVRVLSSISLPGADAPLSTLSSSSSSSSTSSSSSLVRRHRHESKSLLSSKLIVPATLQVKSKKIYSSLHELIVAGKFDETVKNLFGLISSSSSTSTTPISQGLTKKHHQSSPNSIPGAVKSSWLSMLSRKGGSITSTTGGVTSSTSSLSSNAFSRFRLSQTSVSDLVSGRRAVPPSQSDVTPLSKAIRWDSLAYISDEDLNEINAHGEDYYDDDNKNAVKSNITEAAPAATATTTGSDSFGVGSGGGGGGGGRLLAAQMAALQSRSLSDPQHDVSIFGDAVISLEKSPLTHINSSILNGAVLSMSRNSYSTTTSSIPHVAPLAVNELMRHGAYLSPSVADVIASIAANQFYPPPSSTSSFSSSPSSLAFGNVADADDHFVDKIGSRKSLSSSSLIENNLYLLPLLTHLRAQAAAVISDLPGASQLQKHIPVLGSGLGSSGINYVLSSCSAIGALSIALEILDEIAPLYIVPGRVSGDKVGVSSETTTSASVSSSSVVSKSVNASVEPLVQRILWTPDLKSLSALKQLAMKERETGVSIALDILIKKETQHNQTPVLDFTLEKGVRNVDGELKRDSSSSTAIPLALSQQQQHQQQ